MEVILNLALCNKWYQLIDMLSTNIFPTAFQRNKDSKCMCICVCVCIPACVLSMCATKLTVIPLSSRMSPTEVFKELKNNTKYTLYSCCCLISKSCLTRCNCMDYCAADFPVLHCLLEFAQSHVH